MSPDNKKSIYQEEYKKLEAAEKALQSLSDTSNPVHPHFEELYLSYKKLLRQSVQLVSIADRQQERLLNLQNDIAAKNRELEALSITDSLTGIPNRRRFDEVLMQEYARLNRTGAELSLIMLDVDHFKAFNDNYGHVKGDACLQMIATVLKSCASRPGDLAARYGGEEFACILPETDVTGAFAVAEKIRCDILSLVIPHTGSSTANLVTASMGVVSVRCHKGGSCMDIVSRADKMLYRAKSNGRNRVESAKEGTLL